MRRLTYFFLRKLCGKTEPNRITKCDNYALCISLGLVRRSAVLCLHLSFLVSTVWLLSFYFSELPFLLDCGFDFHILVQTMAILHLVDFLINTPTHPASVQVRLLRPALWSSSHLVDSGSDHHTPTPQRNGYLHTSTGWVTGPIRVRHLVWSLHTLLSFSLVLEGHILMFIF